MAVATPYCTLEDMQRLFSTQGVTAFADHDGDGQDDSLDGTAVTTDCIDQATEEINLYAMQFYSATALSGSSLITRWCTVLAVYFLCQRRGNPDPASIEAEFQRIMANLERVRTGELKIPGLAYKGDLRPSFSNMTVDRRWPFSRVRAIPQSSDNIPTTLTQKPIGVVSNYE